MTTAATIDSPPGADLFEAALGVLRAATSNPTAAAARPATGSGGCPEQDYSWFPDFYSETASRLRGYVGQLVGNAALADDITQEAYLRVLRTELPTREPARLRSYLYRTATNLARDHWRLRKRRGAEESLDGIAEPAAEAPADAPLGADVNRLLGTLSRQQRSLLWLAYVEGATHREIASVLDVREASVRVLLFRARRKMAELIRSHGLIPEEPT